MQIQEVTAKEAERLSAGAQDAELSQHETVQETATGAPNNSSSDLTEVKKCSMTSAIVFLCMCMAAHKAFQDTSLFGCLQSC